MRSNLGGKVYALSEMVDHLLLLQDYYRPSEGINPGLVGLGRCERLSTQLKTKKMIAEKCPVRHSVRIQ